MVILLIQKILNYLRKNHLAAMAVCCALPVVLIFGLQFIGLKGWWVFPLALVLCVGTHALMMFLGKPKDEQNVTSANTEAKTEVSKMPLKAIKPFLKK